MTYIIDLLREHDQFENLLSGSPELKENKNGLDKALIHYLQSKHPEDVETLRMVALHFRMNAEV